MILMFCDVDENGEITWSAQGPNLIPDRQRDFFFYLDEEIEAMNYKVVLNGYKASLVLK